MEPAPVGLAGRLWLAFLLPWKILVDGVLAARTKALLEGPVAEPEPEPEIEPVPPVVPETDLTPALQLLGILQREGRFVDFLQEDVTDVPDADIGAAARVVHAGCKKGLDAYITVRAVRSEAEGDAVVLEPGFDAARHRVTGNVAGSPPYSGHLAHHGWEVERIELPTVAEGHDARVLAPAEVEV